MSQPQAPMLVAATTEKIVDRLVLDMLQRFHSNEQSPQRNAAIERYWKARRGAAFLRRSVTPTYLRGYPGQGKTTCFRVAAATVAEMLEMRFVENPAEDYVPSGEELLFVVQELSGQVSAVDFGGIPNVQSFAAPDGAEQRFMTKLANKRLAMLQHAGAAVLLLDDFSNASPNIQNVALSILTENRFQGLRLGRTLVGATGNLGSSDGTHVSATSNAIVTRVANFLVEDDLDNWVQRTLAAFPDAIGDAGIGGFLKRYPDLFHQPKRSRDGIPYPCPRTWSLFVPKLREIRFCHHSQCAENPEAPFPYSELEFEAAALLGQEAAHKLAGYYLSLFYDSDPLARALITEGAWSKEGLERFRKHYARGHAALSQQFGYQFVTALADYSAKAFLDDLATKENWPTIAGALGAGLYGERIDHALICYGAHYFALRVVLLARERSADTATIGALDSKGRPELCDSFVLLLIKQFSKHPIALEIIERGDTGQRVRLLDDTFCQIVSNFRGYD